MTNFILKVVAWIFFILISIINLFSLAVIKTVNGLMNVFIWTGNHFVEIFAGVLVISGIYYLLTPPELCEEEEIEKPIELVLNV